MKKNKKNLIQSQAQFRASDVYAKRYIVMAVGILVLAVYGFISLLADLGNLLG